MSRFQSTRALLYRKPSDIHSFTHDARSPPSSHEDRDVSQTHSLTGVPGPVRVVTGRGFVEQETDMRLGGSRNDYKMSVFTFGLNLQLLPKVGTSWMVPSLNPLV